MSVDSGCPTIYGPKNSRRQGLSLGINLGDPEQKCCSWSCVYCQCGYGIKGDEAPRVPKRSDVVHALERALAEHRKLDSVTVAGNSEPTAYPEFLELIEDILALRARRGEKWIFNCLSNGSELERESVRKACDLLDEAWIKIDCGDDVVFQRVNRPLARLGGVAAQVERICGLKNRRLQTLLWDDQGTRSVNLANNTKANKEGLLAAYAKIQPLVVHLTTVQRDPATPGIIPITEAELQAFAGEIRRLGIEVQVFT